MKCDELKPCTYDDMIDGDTDINIEYYPKSDVDAAIAELKDKCKMHDFFWEGCGFAKRGFKNTIAVSEAFDRLEAENAELKQKLESVQASMYCDVVDANMEIRRLKRALWLARAELCRRLDVDRYLRNHRNSWYNENCLTWADACVAMEVKMCKAETKCRAKAEEYNG